MTTYTQIYDQAQARIIEADIRQLEADGHRIVDGGQICGYDARGECGYRYTDYRTGNVLVEGRGTYEDDERETNAYPGSEHWIHIDSVTEHADEPEGIEIPKGDRLPLWALTKSLDMPRFKVDKLLELMHLPNDGANTTRAGFRDSLLESLGIDHYSIAR